MKLIRFIICILMLSLLCSCVDERSLRVIVEEYGYGDPDNPSNYLIADIHNLEAMTELSSQLVLCEIKELESARFKRNEIIEFTYKVEILEIYMDARDTFKVGDTVSVISDEGVLKAAYAAELEKASEIPEERRRLDGEYVSNEYVTCSMWKAIPIEVGKQYIMFLADHELEKSGKYIEYGRMFLYECDGNKIYTTRDVVLSDKSKDELVAELSEYAANRTGRADEIGWIEYMEELNGYKRVIVAEFGSDDPDSLAFMPADINNLEAVTELSSQLVLCKVKELEHTEITKYSKFRFTYNIEILDILMDARDTFKVGDTVGIESTEGMLRANEVVELDKKYDRIYSHKKLEGTYAYNEYVSIADWDAIPLEVGKTYIMFLSDDRLDTTGNYTESGRMFMYGYDGEEVYITRDAILSEQTKSELIDELSGYVANRTGRADEVGHNKYMDELGERQAEEYKASKYGDT